MTHTCPKCAKPNPDGELSCAFCGIVFARYQATRKRPRPKPKPPQRIYARQHFMHMKGQAFFFQRLGKLLEAGLPLNQALDELKTHGRGSGLAEQLIPHVGQGYGLSESLTRSGAELPSYVWGHLEAGEVSGHLPELLNALANEIQARRKRILAAIFNLRMLGFMVILAGASMSLSVTGAVGALSDAHIQGGVGSVLKGIAAGTLPRFLTNALLFGGMYGVGAWFQLVGKHQLTLKYQAFEAFRLKLPLFGDVLIADSLIRYLDLLSRLMDAGIPLTKALAIAKGDLEFPRWAASFDAVVDAVHAGADLSVGFAKVPNIPREMLTELRVGEKTGGLPEGMSRFAAILKSQVTQTRTIVIAIQSGLLFCLGAMIALYAIVRGIGAWIPLYERQMQ